LRSVCTPFLTVGLLPRPNQIYACSCFNLFIYLVGRRGDDRRRDRAHHFAISLRLHRRESVYLARAQCAARNRSRPRTGASDAARFQARSKSGAFHSCHSDDCSGCSHHPDCESVSEHGRRRSVCDYEPSTRCVGGNNRLFAVWFSGTLYDGNFCENYFLVGGHELCESFHALCRAHNRTVAWATASPGSPVRNVRYLSAGGISDFLVL